MRPTSTRDRELYEIDMEIFQEKVERVKSLLISKGAEDLIDMITGGIGERLITELPQKMGGKG